MKKSIRFFFISLLLYQVSNWLQNTTLNFYVYSKTESTLSVGVVQFLQYSPLLFLPFFGGILIDKFDKYKMLIFTQFSLMILSFLLYLFAIGSTNNVMLSIFFAVMFIGILKAFDIPLRQAIIAHLVSTDKLKSAISIYSTIVNFSRFMGPFLFGMITYIFSIELGFLISALLLFLNVYFLISLKEHIQYTGQSRVHNNSIFSAISFISERKDVRNIFIFVLVMGIFGWYFYILLPEYVYKILHLSPSVYGYLTSLSGIGSIFGAFLPVILKDVHTYFLMRLGVLVYALGISLWFLSIYFYPLLGLGTFLNGYGLSLFYTSANAEVQLATQKHIKGRVLSLYTSIFIGSQPLSFIIGAFLNRYLGMQITLLLAILACITLYIFIRENTKDTPFQAP